MTIEIPTLEIITILFLLYAFKWFFRLLVIVFIGKMISQLKEKGSNSLKEVMEKTRKATE